MSLLSSATSSERIETQLLIVELRGSSTLYGIPGRLVREIAPQAPATRLPGAPAHVRGIMNLRGQLVTVVDLAQRLSGQPARNADASTIVVHWSGDGENGASTRMLGLIVDDVRDVHSVDSAADEALPYRPGPGDLALRLGRLGDEVVIVLDIDQLVRETFG